jgi:hypothetical protein
VVGKSLKPNLQPTDLLSGTKNKCDSCPLTGLNSQPLSRYLLQAAADAAIERQPQIATTSIGKLGTTWEQNRPLFASILAYTAG